MPPSPFPLSAALTIAELLGPLSVVLLVSVLATFAVLIAWLVGERLERRAWRQAATARRADDRPVGPPVVTRA
jgi:VIT1/CCC1 family predicted Fe2+/Mn2+ transporter